jgi:hypothetical protein
MSSLSIYPHSTHYKSDHGIFCSNSFQERTELGDNEENQEKTVLVKDKENKRTHKALLELASPS